MREGRERMGVRYIESVRENGKKERNREIEIEIEIKRARIIRTRKWLWNDKGEKRRGEKRRGDGVERRGEERRWGGMGCNVTGVRTDRVS